MRHWTTSRKLWATLGLMWVGMLILMAWTAMDKRAGLVEERVASLEHFVDSARDLVGDYVERAERGELNVDEAKSRAIDRLATLSFGEGGYIFGFDNDIRIVAHPRRETGDDMSGHKDVNGKPLYRELKSVSDSNPEDGGYVEYMSERAEAGGGQVPKLSYVQKVPGWDWNLAAGVYMDDIAAAFWKSTVELGILLLLVGAILTLVMGWIIRDVLRSLGGDPRHAQEVVQRIAGGDLTHPLSLKSGDETSLLARIEEMRKRLVSSLGNIRQSTDSIHVGVSQIASGNEDLSARTEQQAASIEETAASMEQLTQTVRQNADNAQQASALATEASSTARRGGDMMDGVVSTMKEISASSNRVQDIIKVIDSIAFQTNILALNASVEAARAGEQGRGFAVVASEVRTLASRSAEASREIRTLIEESNQQISSGSHMIDQTGETIRDVVTSVTRVTDLMQEISSASREQSAGIEQVSQAVGQMDQVTQQNASLVVQASTAAASLSEQAEHLVQEVVWFRITEDQRPQHRAPSAGKRSQAAEDSFA